MRSINKKRLQKNKKIDSALVALNFFAEAGLLKRIRRSGWWVAGIKNPESVAEHSFRCAIIAYWMAHEEKTDPYRAVLMALFNDIHEARINDLHKMGHYYIDFKTAEKKVFGDQVQHFDRPIKGEVVSLRKEYDAQKTKASLIARDADILECLIQAKEYYDDGHAKAKLFLNRAPSFLKTRSAKRLWKRLARWDSALWWQKVVKFER